MTPVPDIAAAQILVAPGPVHSRTAPFVSAGFPSRLEVSCMIPVALVPYVRTSFGVAGSVCEKMFAAALGSVTASL